MLADDIKKLERNVYSQYGEDGIVEWIFSRLAPGNKICVEFGAWDGRNLSNTFNLIAHHGWKAIYIEADPEKFPALQQTAAAYPAITPVRSLVTPAGDTALDAILRRHDVPEEFDLLSIDIDGNDYDVWDASTRYRPRLVIVEFNPTFPSNSAISITTVAGSSARRPRPLRRSRRARATAFWRAPRPICSSSAKIAFVARRHAASSR